MSYAISNAPVELFYILQGTQPISGFALKNRRQEVMNSAYVEALNQY